MVKRLCLILILLLLLPSIFAFNIEQQFNYTIVGTNITIVDNMGQSLTLSLIKPNGTINWTTNNLDCDSSFVKCFNKDFKDDTVSLSQISEVFNLSKVSMNMTCPSIPACPANNVDVKCNDNLTSQLSVCLANLENARVDNQAGWKTYIDETSKGPFIIAIAILFSIGILILYNHFGARKKQPPRQVNNDFQFQQPPRQLPPNQEQPAYLRDSNPLMEEVDMRKIQEILKRRER